MKFSRIFFQGLLTLALFINTSIALAQSDANVWDELRALFTINHETTQPAVQQQLRWLMTHPSYLHKLSKAEPYIYHIVTEIKKRKLPGEIALIPMIESAYDPFAYSGVGAAGLWQLMPGTGTDLGLKQDWWFDGRRSIRPSTDAALNYLWYLHNFFDGDWLLAFAAYDSGEGTVARVIKNSHQSSRHASFWSLALPNETKAYIPRLLALAEVIKNPQRYHVELPDIPHTPYFEEVNIGSQIDLTHAAKLAGISYHDLIKLNPGFNHWATAPYRPYKLLIPADRVEDFSRNLAHLPEDERTSWTRHQVSAGDSLILIARRYHTTVNLIKELNQLKSNSVKKGQYVIIPKQGNVPLPAAIIPAQPVVQKSHFIAANKYKVIHFVQKNESLQSVAKLYNISALRIRSWNHLKPGAPLRYRQQLVIWKQAQPTGTYIIKHGDNLSSIAQKNRIPMATIIRLNPGLKKHYLRPGQKILLG